jgi:hypothetical protein
MFFTRPFTVFQKGTKRLANAQPKGNDATTYSEITGLHFKKVFLESLMRNAKAGAANAKPAADLCRV